MVPGPSTGTFSVVALFELGKSLIDALAHSEDAYTISGYLARAYEGVPNFSVDILQQDEVFTPVYSEEVLTQIENSFTIYSFGARLTDSTSTNPGLMSSNSVTQDVPNNAILCNPQFAVAATSDTLTSGGVNSIMSLRQDNPTPELITIATRLLNSVQYLYNHRYYHEV